MCHAAEPSYEGIYHAPKGVMLETDAAIAEHAREIYLQAGRSHAMPPGNVTQITPQERALLVAWYEQARRTDRPSRPTIGSTTAMSNPSARPHAFLPALARQRRRPRRLCL